MNESFTRQAIARTVNAIKMLLGRGRVIMVLNNDQDSTQRMQVKVSAKETMDLYRLAEFGFASRPPKDSDCVVVFLNGERTWGIVTATGHQTYRFKLENDGEMAIHDAFGKSIWFKKTGGIVVEAGTEPITINNAKGMTANFSDDVTLNMGGKKVIIAGAGEVHLDGAGGRKVVCDGDPVTGGIVHASAGQKVFGSP